MTKKTFQVINMLCFIFQSLTTFAKQRKEEVGLFDGVRPVPSGVYTHGSH
jgi:hypothetical protein